MESNYRIVVLSMEILISGFSEPARTANSRGGLAILIGDETRGFAKLGSRVDFIVPFYHYYRNFEEKICYDSLAQKTTELNIPVNNKYTVPVRVWDVQEGSVKIHGLECPLIFDFLYNLDRWQQLRQEVVFGKTVSLLLKSLGTKPDIILANESHTAVAISEIKEDPDFKEIKIVFVLHTKHPAGLERFPEQWFDESGINKNHRSEFIRDGAIDFVWAAMDLADGVIAVSNEFGQIAKEMFPQHAHKIVGIRNGSYRDLWLSPTLKAAEEAGENIDLLKLWTIHQADKKELLNSVKQRTGMGLSMTKPLVGWVRRITDFKNQYPMLQPIIRAICAEKGVRVDTPLGQLEGLGMQMFCAGTAAADNYRSWVEEFHGWTKDPALQGNFAFLSEYNFNLLKMTGFDIWLHCPWPGWEACGTSGLRHKFSGTPSLATPTGGEKECTEEFNPETSRGNGFFINPYDSITVYKKLKIYSDIYYDWQEYGIPALLLLNKNAYETGKTLDITYMIEKYQEKVFAPLLSSSQ